MENFAIVANFFSILRKYFIITIKFDDLTK